MPISDAIRAGFLSALLAGVTLAGAGGAYALDEKTIVEPGSDSRAMFRFGYSAYRNGHKDEAAEAYRYAAENGQLGARWALARMYAAGDGVREDDYEAFKFYSGIVEQGVEPGSQEESYLSDALVAVAGYLRTGIPGSPVHADPLLAQEYYREAATTYRNPVAQFEIGRMFLLGEGVTRSVKHAGRWLQLAAEKQHAGAQAMLGDLLFQGGKVVRGLAMMTVALHRSPATDRPWIRGMHEDAFALAGESDRLSAMKLADEMLKNGDQAFR